MSQKKLQTVIIQNLGGLKRCIMGFVQVENMNLEYEPSQNPLQLENRQSQITWSV